MLSRKRKRILEVHLGLRVLFRETTGALMQKRHDEGVSTNLGRSIKMGQHRLEEEGERRHDRSKQGVSVAEDMAGGEGPRWRTRNRP